MDWLDAAQRLIAHIDTFDQYHPSDRPDPADDPAYDDLREAVKAEEHRRTLNSGAGSLGTNGYRIGPYLLRWVELGEGFNGDYDPEDPTDEELLRLDVLTSEPPDEFNSAEDESDLPGWYTVRDGSFCTNVPASLDWKRRRALLMAAGRYLTTRGGGLGHRLQMLSHMNSEGTDHLDALDPFR